LGLIKSESGIDEKFYHSDGLGSTRLLTDGTGQVTDRYVYDAFGRLIAHAGGSGNAYQFAGEQRDSTGLDYLRARYYNSDLGRFISKDAFAGHLASPISENAYVYANANPINFTDPSGYESLGELSAAEAINSILSSISAVGVRSIAATVGGALAAGVFDISRQGYEMIDSLVKGDGRKTELDGAEVLESMRIGGIAGALFSVLPQAAIYFAFQGVKSGAKEIQAGNIATGAFDIATSIIPFFDKNVRDATFSPIKITIGENTIVLLDGINSPLPTRTTGAGLPPRWNQYDPVSWERSYDYIREINHQVDVNNISANTGIQVEVINSVREHLFFDEHIIKEGTPAQRFEADPEISKLWIKAGREELQGQYLIEFKSIVAHEYVERALMKNGFPFRGTNANPGAHEIAPNASPKDNPFEHWKNYPGWADLL
jgi:RHS repeat-associated protein